MVEWKSPVELPRFNNEEMDKKRREYVQKYGYYVTIPGLEEIIHLKAPKEPTQEEFDNWRVRERAEYLIRRYPTSRNVRKWREEADAAMAEHRYFEISDLIEDKRLRARRIAASPVPTTVQNIGSVMTFLDDVNDMLGTAGVVMRFAAKLTPRFAKRLFLGPAGWLFLAADIAGIVMSLMQAATALPATCLTRKRYLEDLTTVNPFSKKAKTARARKLRKWVPSKGEIIEGLQTTDQLFGVGLCLGPIVGFGMDVISGTVRAKRGEKVTWFRKPPDPYRHERRASLMMRHAHAASLIRDEFTEAEHFASLLALNGATQILIPYLKEWNPLDEVEGLEHALIEAPTPEFPTTRFVLEEMGIDWTQAVGWPTLNKRDATILELWDADQDTAAKAFWDFCERNRHNDIGMVGAQNAYEFALNMQGMIEAWETVDVEYEPYIQQWVEWHKNGCQFIGCQTASKQGCMRYQLSAYMFGDQWLYVW